MHRWKDSSRQRDTTRETGLGHGYLTVALFKGPGEPIPLQAAHRKCTLDSTSQGWRSLLLEALSRRRLAQTSPILSSPYFAG